MAVEAVVAAVEPAKGLLAIGLLTFGVPGGVEVPEVAVRAVLALFALFALFALLALLALLAPPALVEVVCALAFADLLLLFLLRNLFGIFSF